MSVRPNRRRAPGVAALVCVALGCAPRELPVDGPASPRGGLEFPSLEVEWTPPALAAGDVDGLAAAITGHPRVTLVLGPRLAGATWAGRAAAMLAALSPNTTVAAVRHAELAAQVEPAAGLLELRREGESARPRYAATVGLTAAAGAGAVVAIDDVAVDPQRWQALTSSSVGSCEPAMRALADGQEAGLTRLAPFLDLADARIGEVYRAKLRARVATLAPPGQATQDERGRCVQAYQGLVQAATKCVGDAQVECPGTPRLVLVGGARVVAQGSGVPEKCAGLVGGGPERALRELADAAAREVTAGLDGGWTVLADRLGTLTEVHAALEDVCVPRRRRFTDGDVGEMRARLARVGAALASDEVRSDGGWVAGGEKLAVPGLGTTRVVLRFAAGEGSVNAVIVEEARALREFVLGRALCKAGHAATPLAAVVGVPGRPAQFLGYFYEEELLCGELGPLRG